jgi:hypothetical protein
MHSQQLQLRFHYISGQMMIQNSDNVYPVLSHYSDQI